MRERDELTAGQTVIGVVIGFAVLVLGVGIWIGDLVFGRPGRP